MSPLKQFQNQYGRDWGELIQQPAFAQALALANSEKIQKIAALSDIEISTHGKIILADLRGHLQYESGLLGLHEKKEFVFQQELGPPDYADPIEEARLEALVEEQIESGVLPPEGALFPSSAHEQIFPPPQKKRGRPPKKGRKK